MNHIHFLQLTSVSQKDFSQQLPTLSISPPMNKSLYLMSILCNVSQTTINTGCGFSITIANFNILQGMSQSPAATITHGHIPLNFDRWNFLDEFEGVGSMLAQFVLKIDEGGRRKIKFATRENN